MILNNSKASQDLDLLIKIKKKILDEGSQLPQYLKQMIERIRQNINQLVYCQTCPKF